MQLPMHPTVTDGRWSQRQMAGIFLAVRVLRLARPNLPRRWVVHLQHLTTECQHLSQIKHWQHLTCRLRSLLHCGTSTAFSLGFHGLSLPTSWSRQQKASLISIVKNFAPLHKNSAVIELLKHLCMDSPLDKYPMILYHSHVWLPAQLFPESGSAYENCWEIPNASELECSFPE
jgi:hypothetical protein